MTPKPRKGDPVGAASRADLRSMRATLVATLAATEHAPQAARNAAIAPAGGRCDLLLDFDGHAEDLTALRDEGGAAPLELVAAVGSLFALRIDTGYLDRQLALLESWNDAGAAPANRADGASLAGLVAAGAVRRASLGRTVRPASGTGAASAARRPVREAARAEVAARGEGVTVGIIDTVFDYAHVAMLPPGQTLDAPPPPNEALRIARLFDPYAARPDAAGFGISHACTDLASDIAACLAAAGDRPLGLGQRDAAAGGDTDPTRRQLFANHGTFCAGIAAGSGNASAGARFRGIAPAATLACAIAGIQDNAVLADSLDVIAATVRLVEDCDRPLALLLNNGDCLGAHDGTLLGELLLDELLLHPGRAIVLPAGNQNVGSTDVVGAGKQRIVPHIAIPGSATEPRTERLAFGYTTRAAKADNIEIWFEAKGDPVATLCTEPDSLPIEPLDGGQLRPIRILSLRDGQARMTMIVELGRAAHPRLWRLRVLLLPVRDPMPIDRLRFEITNVVGELHAWCDWNNETQRDWEEPASGRQDDVTTLTTPATAHRVIVAGECVEDAAGFRPAEASGRGPTRDGRLKPDVVAIGSALAVPVPQRSPEAHRNLAANCRGQPERLERLTYGATVAGTSFTAPQVTGLAALLLEKWPEATWADIRQAIVEAALRPEHWLAEGEVPPAGGDAALPCEAGLRAFGWDRALGYGRIDVARTLDPPPPAFDVGIRKAEGDDGREPHVAPTLWAAPDIAVLGPHRVRVRSFQRGSRPVDGPARLHLFHAPFGAIHPLPRIGAGASSQWQPLLPGGPVTVAAGESIEVETRGDIDLQDGTPRAIAAILDHDQDRYEPDATLGMRNNVAVLSTAIGNGALPPLTILGSEDVDSLLAWSENLDGALSLRGIPITALPWRTARLFLEDDRLRSWKRPYFGQADAVALDPANRLAEEDDLRPRAGVDDPIAALTGITGATALSLRRADGEDTLRVDAATTGRLWLPRLRLAQGQALTVGLHVAAARQQDPARPGWLHVVHFSGGRRVGGGSVRIAAAP